MTPVYALALRLQILYDVGDDPGDLARLAWMHGARWVVDRALSPGQSGFGYREDTQRAACVIAEAAPPFEQAHEAAHAVLYRRAQDGLDDSELAECCISLEDACDRIAEVLAGPDPPREPSEALRGFKLPAHVDVLVRACVPAPPPEFVPDEPAHVGGPSTDEMLEAEPFRRLFLWPCPRVRSAVREVFRGTCRRPR